MSGLKKRVNNIEKKLSSKSSSSKNGTKKNKVGRPLKFKSVEELKEKIDKYFEFCDEKEEPYTVTGLNYFLDISKEVLVRYEGKSGFKEVIKKARLKIESYLEKKLQRSHGNIAGLIFILKNHYGWRDVQEVKGSQDVSIKIIDRFGSKETEIKAKKEEKK